MSAKTSAERKAAQREHFRKVGNTDCFPLWIPNNPDAKKEAREFAAELRRKYGTMLPEDLVL